MPGGVVEDDGTGEWCFGVTLAGNEMEQKHDFIPFIHVLRGLAPLLVVWSHLAGWWFFVNSSSPLIWTWYQQLIVDPLRLCYGGGHLGVVLFFCISGYIISHVATHERRIEFVVKRIFRLAPVLFVAVALMALLAELSQLLGLPKMLGNEAVHLRDYIVTAFLLNYIIDRKPLTLGGVTWSLGSEVIFYALVTALIPLMRGRPIMATWMMTAAATALVLPWPSSDALAYACYFSIYLPLFIIGRIFYLEHTKQLDSHTALTMVGANAGLLCLLYSFRWPGKLTEAPTEPAVTYFMAIILFYIVMRTPIRTMPRSVRFFADISYSLYLVHLPAGSFAMAAVSALGAPRPIILIAGLCAAVGAATAISRFVERPCQALGRHLLRNAASLLEGLPCRFLPKASDSIDAPVDDAGAPYRW